MRNVDTLLERVNRLRVEVDKSRPGREWSIELEDGEPLCEELEKQLGPHDTVIIRYYPHGYLGEDDTSTSGQIMSSWLPGPRGHQKPHVVRQYGCDISKV